MAFGYSIKEARQIAKLYTEKTKMNMMEPFDKGTLKEGDDLDRFVKSMLITLEKLEYQDSVKSYELVQYSPDGAGYKDDRKVLAIAGTYGELENYLYTQLDAKLGKEPGKYMSTWYAIEESRALVLSATPRPK